MTTVYGIIFAVALAMIGVYFFVDRKRDIWLMLLFVSVAVCDLGYYLLSASQTLDSALWSNRISYLGCVFLPFSLLMMIMNLSRFKYAKMLPRILLPINSVMFLIAASGGILPIYYKDVSLGFSNGAAYLIKEYGPLHKLYKVFLFAYFVAMVAIIVHTAVKKTVVSTKHSVFLAFVVIGNIVTWLVENMIGAGFEFLSISYIVSEGLILFLYGILQDYGIADTQKISEPSETPLSEANENITSTENFSATENITANDDVTPSETIKAYTESQIEIIFSNWKALSVLSQREKEVLAFLLENKKRRNIAETLFVTESTIKKHTSAIFKKLEITNRTELFEKAKEYLQ